MIRPWFIFEYQHPPLWGNFFSFTWTPRRRSVTFASLSMFLFSILVFNFIPYSISGQFFLVLYYLMQDKVDWFRIAPNVFISFLFWNLIHFFFIHILVFTSDNFNKLKFSFFWFYISEDGCLVKGNDRSIILPSLLPLCYSKGFPTATVLFLQTNSLFVKQYDIFNR